MVGIVIVSHSAMAAEGIKQLAMQMSDSGLKIVTAAGMPDGSLGTDSLRIIEAVQEANKGGHGVVIMVDLGSAVLSAKMAIELLGEEFAHLVKIADAPLLEGAVGAAIQASIGASLDEVVLAAEMARGMTKL